MFVDRSGGLGFSGLLLGLGWNFRLLPVEMIVHFGLSGWLSFFYLDYFWLCYFTPVACPARVFFSFLQQKEKNQKKVPPFVQSLRGT